LKREIHPEFREHLEDRKTSILKDREGRSGLSLRGFWVGIFLSFFLAIGAPYVTMAMRATVMAFDFNTPGAIFLFLVLIGLLNVLFKVGARDRGRALGLAAAAVGLYLFYYLLVAEPDPHSPGFIFSSFVAASSLINLPVVWRGRSLALNRSEHPLCHDRIFIPDQHPGGGGDLDLSPALQGGARGADCDRTGVYWPGLGFFLGGGLVMLLLTWTRQHLVWWPFHPIGFPIGANYLLNHVWSSVFIAWVIKKLVLRFGGAAPYRTSQTFFLGFDRGRGPVQRTLDRDRLLHRQDGKFRLRRWVIWSRPGEISPLDLRRWRSGDCSWRGGWMLRRPRPGRSAAGSRIELRAKP